VRDHAAEEINHAKMHKTKTKNKNNEVKAESENR